MRGEFLFALGHFAVPDEFEEVAGGGIAGHDGGAVLIAGDDEAAQPEVEAAFFFPAFAVAVEAVRFEQRPDVCLENGSGGERPWESGGGSEGGREKSHCGDYSVFGAILQRAWGAMGGCRRRGW